MMQNCLSEEHLSRQHGGFVTHGSAGAGCEHLQSHLGGTKPSRDARFYISSWYICSQPVWWYHDAAETLRQKCKKHKYISLNSLKNKPLWSFLFTKFNVVCPGTQWTPFYFVSRDFYFPFWVFWLICAGNNMLFPPLFSTFIPFKEQH